MVLDWLDSVDSSNDLHSLASDALKFVKAHPDPANGPAILLRVYESTPCAHCRKIAVQQMIELRCLPPEIAEECRFDANDEIRALAAGL